MSSGTTYNGLRVSCGVHDCLKPARHRSRLNAESEAATIASLAGIRAATYTRLRFHSKPVTWPPGALVNDTIPPYMRSRNVLSLSGIRWAGQANISPTRAIPVGVRETSTMVRPLTKSVPSW